MMKFTGIAGAVVASMFFVGGANASNYLELGTKKKTETILNIGIAPVKKKTELNLGALRTGEVELPRGELTRAERMALRAKRAVSRQRQVAAASRKRIEQVKKRRREQNPQISSGEEFHETLQ